MEIKGIDVSVFQGDIDWNKVENDGNEFAIIRSSYGTSGVDKKFVQNIKGISKTSMHAGAYHYCYAKNTETAIKEARHFLDTINGYTFSYPIVLDIEDPSLVYLGKEVLTNICLAFCNTLKKAGCYPAIYSSLHWFNNYLNTAEFDGIKKWVAQWNHTLTYSKDCSIWQYTSSGKVSGISTDVDKNICFEDFPSIIKAAGFNNTEPEDKDDAASEPIISEPIVPKEEKQTVTTYTVKKGNTLWGIAEKLLGSGSRYKEIKVLNNLVSDTIYAGQILKIPSSKNKESISVVSYTVKKGDTLWGIAERLLGSGLKYKEIKALNGLSGDTIYSGQILKIPS